MKIYTLIALLPIFLFSATTTSIAPELSPKQLADEHFEQEVTMRVMTIKQIETGNKKDCANVRGGSGEIGCWQILPSTLEGLKKKHKIQVKGTSYEVQRLATIEEIKSHVIKGYTPAQTFLKWNSGNLRPCRKGVNKWGVKYNSCEYVNKAIKIYSVLK
jgi:hypothetical protein